jgi:hypothetical protein
MLFRTERSLPPRSATLIVRPVNHRLHALNCLKKWEVFMFLTVSRLLPEVPLILVTATATHLVVSFAQTLPHYKLGQHPLLNASLRCS